MNDIREMQAALTDAGRAMWGEGYQAAVDALREMAEAWTDKQMKKVLLTAASLLQQVQP